MPSSSPADHLADREGDEGRPREVDRGRARPTTSRSRSTPTSSLAAARMAVRPQRGDGLTAPAASVDLERSSSTACSTRSTGATASTSASTRRLRCGGGCRPAREPEGCRASRRCRTMLHDPAVMRRLLLDLSINVTAMFRDPTFYLAFREKVVPLLRTYPFIRIWDAGCSTGEEVYSMAILLEEEGLYDRGANLRDRHQRGGARAGARRASSRWRRCRTTRATTSPRAASAHSPTTTRRRTTARRSTGRCCATSSSRSTTWRWTARSTSSTSSSAAT